MPVEIEEGLSVVIYTRYSTDKQDTSTERQIEQVQKKIIQYGLIEVGRYSDEGLSGTHVLRPSYEQMKADIASGKIEPDILLCASVDRLTREDVMEANAELNHFNRS
jgi:DNA invertase Pin-like site-specific DNA recombinase